MKGTKVKTSHIVLLVVGAAVLYWAYQNKVATTS